MSRRNKAVTLLEVLAVLVLIAVIVVVLFPVFAKARECTRCPSCASNPRQLGLGLVQYIQDNNELLPSGTQKGGLGWGGQIYPYIKSVGIYKCPQDKTSGAFVSYGYNSNVALHPSQTNYPAPARTILLFEVAQDTADVTQWDEGASAGAVSFSAAGDGTDGALRAGQSAARYATGPLSGRPPAPSSQVDDPRHTGGSNFLLADGHVKWHRPGEVSSGADAARASAGPTGATHGSAAGAGSGAALATFSVQ